MKYTGVFTAIVTPFDAAGNLDEEGLRRNIRHQIECGVDGIVALGTTGEAPTLSSKEQKQVIKIAVQEAKGKIAVIIGTGSYSTAQTIEYSRTAEEMGADAVLVVTPYYNKPTQEGLYRHFKALADSISIPIILYNVQGRTAVNIQTETVRRLLDIPRIVATKEASGNILQIADVIEMAAQHRPNFTILSGDDPLTFSLMALGGHGVISVASNLLPKEIKTLVDTLEKRDLQAARDLHYKLAPLFKGIFIETNPMPIKAAMNLCGMPAGPCRLPMCDLLPENLQKLRHIVHSYEGAIHQSELIYS